MPESEQLESSYRSLLNVLYSLQTVYPGLSFI